MRFLKRFSSTLFSPSEIVKYKDDPWWLTLFYFLVLALLLIVPPAITIIQSDVLTYKIKKEIRTHFNGEEDIPFSIQNGILVHNTNDSAYIYKNEIFNINIIMNAGEETNISAPNHQMAIVFLSDGVYLKQMMMSIKLFNYDDYPILNHLDFSDATSYNNVEFWDKIFTVANQEIKSVKPFLNAILIVTLSISSIGNLFLIVLLLSTFQMLILSSYIKYSKLFKLCIYLATPYIFGNVFSYLFNFSILYYIGLLITIIYVFRVSRIIVRDSMKRS